MLPTKSGSVSAGIENQSKNTIIYTATDDCFLYVKVFMSSTSAAFGIELYKNTYAGSTTPTIGNNTIDKYWVSTSESVVISVGGLVQLSKGDTIGIIANTATYSAPYNYRANMFKIGK